MAVWHSVGDKKLYGIGMCGLFINYIFFFQVTQNWNDLWIRCDTTTNTLIDFLWSNSKIKATK